MKEEGRKVIELTGRRVRAGVVCSGSHGKKLVGFWRSPPGRGCLRYFTIIRDVGSTRWVQYGPRRGAFYFLKAVALPTLVKPVKQPSQG
jgi:hypothetical protein